jgi:hypothetical protein
VAVPERPFVERFPRLLQTSRTGMIPERLNKRCTTLIDNHRHLIAGKRILDLASHDGRWSLAALDVGAAHVTGVEARPHLVENAEANCRAYGMARARYRFLLGDVFDTLRTHVFEQVDTVLCFGFFYHVAHHVELIALIDRLEPAAVILDTGISDQPGCSMEWLREKVEDEPNAAPDDYTRDGCALVGYPTRQAVGLLWGHFGYTISSIDWGPCFADGGVGVDDYRNNRRASFLAVRDSSRGWNPHQAMIR